MKKKQNLAAWLNEPMEKLKRTSKAIREDDMLIETVVRQRPYVSVENGAHYPNLNESPTSAQSNVSNQSLLGLPQH